MLFPFVAFEPKPPLAWGLIFILAVLPTYLAHLLFQTGLQRVEASRSVLLLSLEPVVALVTAALFLGERFTPLGLVGVGLILLVSVLAVIPDTTKERGPPGKCGKVDVQFANGS